MRFFVPHITALVLLVHVGLGCCWHHPHHGQADGCVVELNRQAPMVVTCDCHEHATREHASSLYPARGLGEEPDGHRCDGTPCTYVASEASRRPRAELPVDLCLFELPPTGPALSSSSRTLDGRGSYCPRGLPLRTHLLFSLLLI